MTCLSVPISLSLARHRMCQRSRRNPAMILAPHDLAGISDEIDAGQGGLLNAAGEYSRRGVGARILLPPAARLSGE